MLKFKNNEIKATAYKITRNSEVFGDEIASVIAQLSELSNSANRFGCKMEGKISTMWGNCIPVIALPNHYQSNWEF